MLKRKPGRFHVLPVRCHASDRSAVHLLPVLERARPVCSGRIVLRRAQESDIVSIESPIFQSSTSGDSTIPNVGKTLEVLASQSPEGILVRR